MRIGRVARWTCGDRGPKNDRVKATSDDFLDSLRLGDISLNNRQQRSVAGENPCAARGSAARSNNVTSCPRASRAAAILIPTKPVPPKIRIFKCPAPALLFWQTALDQRRYPPTPSSVPAPVRPHNKLAPKFRAGSISATSRPVGFAASPPERARKWPEPGSAIRLPSAMITRPRDSTVTGQPRSLRPA